MGFGILIFGSRFRVYGGRVVTWICAFQVVYM